jgi:hypothetical protein
MKNLKYFLIKYSGVALVACIVTVMSCTSDFDEINTDKNSLSELGPAELPFLFSKAQSAATNNVWTYQIAQNLFADQYAQYFANTTTYFPSDRLVIRMDWVWAAFNPMYTDVLPQLQTIMESTDPTSAENAIANIWWVYTFHRVTDYWGPIPYFNAGTVASSVAYDPQDQIYDDFFKRLDAANDVLQSKAGENAFGSFDLIYGGDVSKWIKFGNTLRLRLAMRISKVDPARAKTEGEAAYAGGVMTTSPDDDALVKRSDNGQDWNGLSIMDWNEFRMSASMESVLKGYDDPRMEIYFRPAANGGYHGLRNGLTVSQLADPLSSNDANSNKGERWSSTTGLATPSNVMATAEAYFLRAEGALLGWNMGGSVEELYEAGITNSMKQWGITDQAVIDAYLNSTSTPVAPGDVLNSPPMTDVPVKFDPARALEQIATQKWLALFPEGMEAWADYRRSRVLNLYPVANSDNPDITNTSTQWIRRIPFLESEYQNNKEATEAAVNLLGGPDKITTPLWWDTN